MAAKRKTEVTGEMGVVFDDAELYSTQRRAIAASEDRLVELAVLSNKLLAAAQEVEEMEEALKQSKERHRQLEEEDLPSLMDEIGLDKIRLTSGAEISVKEDVYCSITASANPRRDEALRWLDEHGFGGLIKTSVVTEFSREQRKAAQKLLAQLIQRGFTAVTREDVNANTLKAFLREQLEKGVAIPLETFNARPVKRAKVKLPTRNNHGQ